MPVQQFGLLTIKIVFQKIWLDGRDIMLMPWSPTPALQADLQPTTAPVGSTGPLRAAGQPGFRSTGQEATGQPLLLLIVMGRL